MVVLSPRTRWGRPLLRWQITLRTPEVVCCITWFCTSVQPSYTDMALIPLEHEERLSSPAQAEAFFRALRERHVSARGFHTRDAAKIERIVDAVEPRREHTISFEDGTLAREPLEALAVTKYQYLDVEASNANLRMWPWLRSWIHARDGADAIAATLGIPLAPGENH